MPYLSIKKNEELISESEIYTNPFKIGRLPTNDLLLPDPSVSREHCVIFVERNEYYIRDLESTNGTFLNNIKVVNPCKLKEGDRIDIGEYSCIFHLGVPSTQKIAPGTLRTLNVETIEEKLFVSQPNRVSANKINLQFYILHQLAKSILSNPILKHVYDTALTMLMQSIDAERGVIFTFNEKGNLEIRAKRSTVGKNKVLPDVNMKILQSALDKTATVFTMDPESSRTIICSPLWEKNKVYGAIYLDTESSRNIFSDEDAELLTAVANMVAIAIKQSELYEKFKNEELLRHNLERFFSPDIVKEILSHTHDSTNIKIDVEERNATVMFVDIKDFTSLSEVLSPHELTEILNEYFEICSRVIFKHRGSINKFIGDGVMAVFGLPFPQDNDAENAVNAGIEIVKTLKEFANRLSPQKRIKPKIGINTGRVIAGNLGSSQRMEYSVLGDTVNIAARLEGIAKPEQILIGEGTYDRVKTTFRTTEVGTIWLKGKNQSVRVFEIII